ncbi:MAG: hypothetical protein U5K81_09895 [Trueperaceae bacterium]|nr:hypothetical protein [Trueperaceae bacterium]
MLRLTLLATLALALTSSLTCAQEEEPAFETSLAYAQVEEVVVTVRDDGRYDVSVTVRHRDEGWDHYADAWQVVDPDSGEVYGERELLHPHDAEQPFTRSLRGLELPDGVTVFTVRARCNVHGFGGREVTVDLSEAEGPSHTVRDVAQE